MLKSNNLTFLNERKKINLYYFDLFMFFLLIAATFLYQLQIIFNGLTFVRILLIIYLYYRSIFFYEIRYTPLQLLVVFYLLYSLFVGFYSYYVFGANIAVEGFIRFVNNALYAPLAYVFFRNIKLLNKAVNLFLLVVFFGVITLIYQLFFGEIHLFSDFNAVRGGLSRFRTLLGEPNIGGMAAVITYICALYLIKSTTFKTLTIFSSIFLLIFSLSKAGLATFALLNIILIIININKIKISFRIKEVLITTIGVLFVFLLIFTNENLEEEISTYTSTFLTEFAGDEAEYGVEEDLSSRLNPLRIMKKVKQDQTYNTINLLTGNGYGIAGTVAKKYKGNQAILPHNSLIEIFIVGGTILLSVFIVILIYTFIKIYRTYKYSKDKNHLAYLLIFIILIIYIPTYPIIYQPILGTLLWLIIGYYSRKNSDNY